MPLILTYPFNRLDLRMKYNPMKVGEEEQVAPLANGKTATLLEVFIPS